ncbi:MULTISPECIES: hypothetical protein [Rhizobium]|uniref:hypothetical protein n=1 Tax=Rhizobium TaxID=379 RepID=UPI00103DC72A|nr:MULTISPECIES: hypothetical protein [Rhizobium]MBY3181924.1 hypothetical protein [Rhizobium laguerreae]MBY3222698.1 hypothetical protein [Rhizobium laguerreae]MBY3382464.1 hypothetical protein [Rhizobium laguerreae]MDU0305853.1 hypothetical protein [Rhizobium sp. 10PS4]NKM23488.1 hypothetical protein [Rhizobium laguerreae]
MPERQHRGPLYPGIADRGGKAAPSRQMGGAVIDARYSMTCSSSLSGDVKDLFIPAEMPGDKSHAFEQCAGDAQQ